MTKSNLSPADDGILGKLTALLDQQQQQGSKRLSDLAALLDQQQQQTGSRGLDELVALLDQQQQQGGGRLFGGR